MTPLWIFIADSVAIVHAGLIAFIGIGLVAIVVGTVVGWEWIRGFWFRVAHLLAIIAVFVQSLAGLSCPLTVLESHLRVRAGQSAYPRDFVGYWVDRLIFHDYSLIIFELLYAAVALGTAVAFILAPPRWPRRVTQ